MQWQDYGDYEQQQAMKRLTLDHDLRISRLNEEMESQGNLTERITSLEALCETLQRRISHLEKRVVGQEESVL